MYLNFQNFRGRTSAGGDKPWSKNGDKCRMGGDWQNFRQMGGPPVPPPEKKPVKGKLNNNLGTFLYKCKIKSMYTANFWKQKYWELSK